MAIDRVPIALFFVAVALLHHIGCPRVGTESACLFRKEKFGIVVIAYYWVMFLCCFYSDANVDHIIAKFNAEFFHKSLEKSEATATGCYYKRVIFQLALICYDDSGSRLDSKHFFFKAKSCAEPSEPCGEILDQLKTAVRTQV